MPNIDLVPAAQYLRQSTRLQQYSIANQQSINELYAAKHGYKIVTTYNDEGRTGVTLRNRPALQRLLNDVLNGDRSFEAILVYDVSRWGRFQNTDEAAHYEYICKLAGKPVHYTAEPFANDGTLPAAIMKTLKRTMAGEYSREQGNRVFRGQRRLAQLGFKVGSAPSYGFRRTLVSSDGRSKQVLRPGERKNLASDHVTLVAGPRKEVRTVQKIFELLLEGRSVSEIAHYLNERGICFSDESPWNFKRVRMILTNPKYTGLSIWGRYSSRLYTREKENPVSEWVQVPNAFPSLISAATYTAAQKVLRRRARPVTNAQLLDRLRQLLARHGRLSDSLIRTDRRRGSRMYGARFGSLENAYKAVGYTPPPKRAEAVHRRRLNRSLRLTVLEKIRALFRPDWHSESCTKGSRRRIIDFACGRTLSVQVLPLISGTTPDAWARPAASDDKVRTARLFCLAAPSLDSIRAFYLAPPGFRLGCRFSEERLQRLEAIRLDKLESLYDQLKQIPICSWKK